MKVSALFIVLRPSRAFENLAFGSKKEEAPEAGDTSLVLLAKRLVVF
jgi:hypothetical protein